MKATGIVRRIDELGRIVIPMELRRTMKLETGVPMEIFVEGDGIKLKRYVDADSCALCGSEDEPIAVKISSTGRQVCRVCATVIRS